jgi:cation diffusion facilitator family transporter
MLVFLELTGMHVRKVLLIEGGINFIVMSCKLSIGLMTNSTAIIADAVHSLSDVANNVIAWIAVKIAESPADDDHHYGHQKFEQIAVFALASLLTIVAFEILVASYNRFGQPVEQSAFGLSILIAVLILNIGLATWEHHWAKRLDSEILHADASHTFSDVLTSISIIIGWQLAAQGFYWLDTVFAMIVAIIIFYLAFKLFQRAIPILVDYSDVDLNMLTEAITHIAGVNKLVRIRVRQDSKGRIADTVVRVNSELTVRESHIIGKKIEDVLSEKFAIKDVLVHFEPDSDNN